MQEVSLFLVFTEALSASGIEYMITGSVAGIAYGEPRLTSEGSRATASGALRVVRTECVACETTVELFFDMRELQH